MLPSALFSRPLAIVGLACLGLLCLISLGEGLKILPSAALAGPRGQVGTIIKRTWESEQGPFSTGPPDNHAEEDKPAGARTSANGGSNKRLGVPGLGSPLLPPINSIVSSVLGAPVPGLPTTPGIPSVPGASGGLFSSVVSVLAGAPSAVPTSPSGNDGPLGGLLSALSQVSPASVALSPTSVPAVQSGSGALLPGLNVLDGVAAALDGVLGSSEDNNSNGDGLLGQLSANIVGPIASIAADPASILANPTAALDHLQSQVSSVLDSLPSAVAAGVQLTSNVGGQVADALDATTEILDNVPDVAGGVADQVGSLLNAAPNLATGLPAAALSAVGQVESVLTAIPDLDGGLTSILGGLKEELSSAVANGLPEVTSLAAVVASQVIGVLPSVLQAPVQGVVSGLQNDVSGLLCQVSDVVSGTAIIFNVPCGSVNSVTSGPGAGTSATAPAAISASITIEETLPLVTTQLAPTSPPPLASVLSSLGSSLMTAETAVASGVDPVASSALSDLSSLFSQISGLSLTATATTSTRFAPPPASAPSSAPSGPVAETTIYYVQTITALITTTAEKTSTVTQCSFGLSSGPSPVPSLPQTDGGPSVTGAIANGPCPDHGYTCDACLDGWFCPPVQTPALPAPCGYGWPCLHCESGWFCVPLPGETAASISSPSVSASAIFPPTPLPVTNGYLYAGCYADNSIRALTKAEISNARGGMTNEHCVDFCQKRGLALAGTEDGGQCFCGNVLLGSVSLSPSHCNVACTGDLTNSTTCGGSWALSVWSRDGNVQQGPNPLLLPSVNDDYYVTGRQRDSPASVETGIDAWLPPAPLASKTYSLISLGVAGLEEVNLSAAPSEVASQPGGTSIVLQSVSPTLNKTVSSVASGLNSATPTSNWPQPKPSEPPLGLANVVSNSPSAADSLSVTPSGPDAASGDEKSVPAETSRILDPMNRHWAPRGRAY